MENTKYAQSGSFALEMEKGSFESRNCSGLATAVVQFTSLLDASAGSVRSKVCAPFLILVCNVAKEEHPILLVEFFR